MIVTGSAQTTRDADWIRRNLPADAHARLTEVGSAYAVITVIGPRARDVLSRGSRRRRGRRRVSVPSIREIEVGHATVLASRRTYVGELGWELYVPADHAGGVYDALMEAGAEFGVCNCGYYAIKSLRLEKGYRAWGRELTPDYNPYEAGLGFAVKLDKGDFIGRDALLAAKGKPPARRLLSFVATSPDTPIAHGGELDPARRRARGRGHIGRVRSLGRRHRRAWLCGDRRRAHR